MKSTLTINVASFYQTQFKQLTWVLNDQDKRNNMVDIERESTTDKSDIREALEDHIDHITAALPKDRVLNDYQVTLSFDTHVNDEQKAEFTTIFNEFNTRDESN